MAVRRCSRFVASEEYKRTMGNAENSALPQMSHRAQIANPFRAMVFGAMADELDGVDLGGRRIIKK